MKLKWGVGTVMNWIIRKLDSALDEIRVQVFKERLRNDPEAAAALTRLRKGIVNRGCISLLVERAKQGTGWPEEHLTEETLAQLDLMPAEKWARRGFLLWGLMQWLPAAIAGLDWLLTPHLGVLEAVREYWFIAVCYVCLSLGCPVAVNWLCRVESEDRVIRRIVRMGGFLDFFENPARFDRTLWAWRARFLRFWLFLPLTVGGVAANIYSVDLLESPWFFVLVFSWIPTMASAAIHNWELEIETAAWMGLDSLAAETRYPFGDAHVAGEDELRKADLI